MARPACALPAACVAKGAGHCRSCHFRALAAAQHAAVRAAGPEADRQRRARMSTGLRAAWTNPDKRARMTARQALARTPQARAKMSARAAAAWADPEKRARRIEGLRRAAADPAVQAKRSAARQARERPAGAGRLRAAARAMVLAAGLPLLKRHVDWAEALMAGAAGAAVVGASLRRLARQFHQQGGGPG